MLSEAICFKEKNVIQILEKRENEQGKAEGYYS